jgi:hypothetical protein
MRAQDSDLEHLTLSLSKEKGVKEKKIERFHQPFL